MFKSTYADFFNAGLCRLNSFIDDYKRHSDKVAKSARRKKIKGLRSAMTSAHEGTRGIKQSSVK